MTRQSRERALASFCLKVLELHLRGQGAEPEEIGGFFKGGFGGELVDIDAAVGEHAGVAVDVADA